MNGICRKTKSKGAEMKGLNAMSGIGFMGVKEVGLPHQRTGSWDRAHSESCATQQLQCYILYDSKLAYFLVSCSEQ